MTHHDDLDRLLESADGPRDLPPGAEDRLLAAILQTAAQPRVGDDHTRGGPAVVESLPDDVDEQRRSHWFLWQVAAAAAAVAAVVGLVSGRPAPAPPSVTGEPSTEAVTSAALGDVGLPTVCSLADHRVETLRLGYDVAPLQPEDATSLRELAVLLGELTDRTEQSGGLLDEGAVARARAAVPVLRLAATQLDAGERDAAARSRSRAGALIVGGPSGNDALLPDLGCPGD